ncbi:MAG: hypothetical protein K2G93_06055 [Rikenella sp.]|nr:hypothetical protein [Rikenella sp.]
MYYIGLSGFSWTSTVEEKNSYYQVCSPERMYPHNFEFRAHGLQLRCLQE